MSSTAASSLQCCTANQQFSVDQMLTLTCHIPIDIHAFSHSDSGSVPVSQTIVLSASLDYIIIIFALRIRRTLQQVTYGELQ